MICTPFPPSAAFPGTPSRFAGDHQGGRPKSSARVHSDTYGWSRFNGHRDTALFFFL